MDFEAGLYEPLHRVAPEHVLAPIAADAGRDGSCSRTADDRALLELARRTGKIARALTWARAIQGDSPDEVWARAPLVTLASLLDASPLQRF